MVVTALKGQNFWTKYLKTAHHEYRRMIMIIRGLPAMVSSMKLFFRSSNDRLIKNNTNEYYKMLVYGLIM